MSFPSPKQAFAPTGFFLPVPFLSIFAVVLTSATAGGIPSTNPPGVPAAAPASGRDWATLYKSQVNPVLNEFKLRGRYHGQYYDLDSDQGNAAGWENRRTRLGFDARLFRRTIEIRLDAQSNDAFDPFYDGLVDAYLKWIPSKAFSLTLGRQKPQIGYYDWLQSTNSQPTFERSQIFNQLRVDRATGAVAAGQAGHFTWQAGLYANDVDREFGSLDGGTTFGGGIGYDFKEVWGLKKADWRLDWLHSRIEAGDTVLNRYENILSSSLWLEEGRWSLVGEVFAATGAAPDVLGFFIQPTYDLIPEKLQLVGRYSFSAGDGPASVSLQRRYEMEAPALTGGGRGNSYQAAYLGLQYFIHGDKLKLLAGAEYARLEGGRGRDFDSTTLLTGIRFSF